MYHCQLDAVHSTDRLKEDLGVSADDLVGVASRISEYFLIDTSEDEIIECKTVQDFIDLCEDRWVG